TVRRTLFRNGDSEYAINNVPCRLLDVQDLLSDAGVGRQQHVIVSQGQIDAVLNARPEERRAIVEEAAGVLKYRKRKEKGERRLDAGVVASLEADAARYRAELDDVEAAAAADAPEESALQLEEQAFEQERTEQLASLDPAPTTTAASAIAEVRGELRTRRT